MAVTRSKYPVELGEIYGYLTVVDFTLVKIANKNIRHAVCICGCGKTTLAAPCTLHSGRKKSCGCKIGRNLVGVKFAKFTVIGEDPTHPTHGRMWSCQCECGVIRHYSSSQVRKKNITECLECYNKRVSKCEPSGEITRGHWYNITKNAKLRNFCLDISVDFAWQLFLKQERKCAISGEPIEFSTSYRRGTTASLDRIDSTIGYTETNSQWVHKSVNLIKMDFPEHEFIEWCNKIVSHQKKLSGNDKS